MYVEDYVVDLIYKALLFVKIVYRVALLFGCNELICYLPFGCKCND